MGPDTHARIRRVLQSVETYNANADAFLITGDLTDKGDVGLYRVPVPDATGGAGDNTMNHNNIIKSKTYDFASETMPAVGAPARSLRTGIAIYQRRGPTNLGAPVNMLRECDFSDEKFPGAIGILPLKPAARSRLGFERMQRRPDPCQEWTIRRWPCRFVNLCHGDPNHSLLNSRAAAG